MCCVVFAVILYVICKKKRVFLLFFFYYYFPLAFGVGSIRYNTIIYNDNKPETNPDIQFWDRNKDIGYVFCSTKRKKGEKKVNLGGVVFVCCVWLMIIEYNQTRTTTSTATMKRINTRNDPLNPFSIVIVLCLILHYLCISW